jgi:hypothetical protein
MRNFYDSQPAAVADPETLDQDMTPRDIADALARLRFRNGMQVIASTARQEIICSPPCAPA